MPTLITVKHSLSTVTTAHHSTIRMTTLTAVSSLKASWLPAPRVLFALLAFAAIGSAGPPSDPRHPSPPDRDLPVVWAAVSMPLYFHYFNGPSQSQPPANGPYTFYFPNPASGAPIPDQFGCTWQEYAPPYFFSNGTLLPPNTVIEKESPAVGTVYLTGAGESNAIRGMGFTGQFTSGISPNQSHNIASVFYSTNDCYAGTLEYGFSYDYFAGAADFYLENNANCPAGSCFDDSAGTVAVSDCSMGFTLPALPLGKGSQADGRNSNGGYDWNYRAVAYYEHDFYRVRVEALDPYDGSDGLTDAAGQQCVVVPNRWNSDNPLGPFHYCPAAKVVYAADTCDANFPMERLARANGAVTATIVKGDAVAYPSTSTPALQITEVEVAK